MNITGKIQSLRKEKGWTITRLAQETNIPTVSLRVMLSREDPNGYTVKNLIKIAEALGVTVSYLTLEEDEKESPSLTFTQREEIKAIISDAIDNYFSVADNGASEPLVESFRPEKSTISELED